MQVTHQLTRQLTVTHSRTILRSAVLIQCMVSADIQRINWRKLDNGRDIAKTTLKLSYVVMDLNPGSRRLRNVFSQTFSSPLARSGLNCVFVSMLELSVV